MERTKNVTLSKNQAAAFQQKQQHQQQQAAQDHRYHFHISERPISTVKNMDRRSKSILCNTGGIIVAEMVYRCLICSSVFETPIDCRTHFRCFHEQNEL